MWIMSSEEFDQEAVRNENGKNICKRGIWSTDSANFTEATRLTPAG